MTTDIFGSTISHSKDPIDAVNELIGRGARCLQCTAVETGLEDADLQIAMRVLLRTSVARPADSCDSCGSSAPAFRAAA